MVTAGTTNAKVIGNNEKKFRKLAWLYRKKVEKKNHPVIKRNMEMTI
jgi:hypothetical protein